MSKEVRHAYGILRLKDALDAARQVLRRLRPQKYCLRII